MRALQVSCVYISSVTAPVSKDAVELALAPIPLSGGGSGGDGENDWTYVIIILGSIGLYIIGGVAYNHKVGHTQHKTKFRPPNRLRRNCD